MIVDFEHFYLRAPGRLPSTSVSVSPAHDASTIARLHPGGTFTPSKTKRSSAFSKSSFHPSWALHIRLFPFKRTIIPRSNSLQIKLVQAHRERLITRSRLATYRNFRSCSTCKAPGGGTQNSEITTLAPFSNAGFKFLRISTAYLSETLWKIHRK
jgi:hypothetical protein